MKYLICSDLHGSECCTKRLTDIFTAESFDYMILLGDILYHGPRNPLPQGHNPQNVVALLNPLKDKIIACRGNCDAEVDQMLLEFPMLADYSLVVDDGVRLFCTHGHIYSPENPPCIGGIDVLLFGHIHVQQLYKKNNFVICNPGSASLPKADSHAGYAVYQDRHLALYNLAGQKLQEMAF